jgi:NitT/TauT family transport system ATP-binding protein
VTAPASLRLTARNIHHSYGTLNVLDGIDLDVAPGEVTVLVGPSGCGKSTLLGILGGMLRPTRGEVRVAGEVGADCLNPLTYVFQDFSLLPWRTVAGNISLVLESTGLSRVERRDRVADVLAVTGLSEFAAAWPKQLSGGMRQRVGIARALAVRPAVLLMDEPLSALDAQTRDILLDEFADLIARTGITIVYVTHNLPEAVRLGHSIVVLSRRPGRVREVVRITRPIQERRATDADLVAVESALWSRIRGDAAEADRELEHAET